ncbi:uncharacterized protein LOC120294502 [Eucalyptus grandis]|uniref:uncharacterized protein LOC120294502 n=1 Tax=Eucalyptus grandis TaxID=71139 RepID=UPI00192ED090|nr:uncharacterized protein LOC120294502 [Eucalyptus grandis]
MVRVQIPHHFRCPISLELMRDLVMVSTGQNYDRSSIEPWIATGNTTCPVTRAPRPAPQLRPHPQPHPSPPHPVLVRRQPPLRCGAHPHLVAAHRPLPRSRPPLPGRLHVVRRRRRPRLSSSFRNRLTPSAAARVVIFLKQDDRQGSGGHCGQPWTTLARPQTRSFG